VPAGQGKRRSRMDASVSGVSLRQARRRRPTTDRACVARLCGSLDGRVSTAWVAGTRISAHVDRASMSRS
jgi:hypothetical protein